MKLLALLLVGIMIGGCSMNKVTFESGNLRSGEWLEPIASYYCPFDSSEMIHDKENHAWNCPKCPYTRDDIFVFHTPYLR